MENLKNIKKNVENILSLSNMQQGILFAYLNNQGSEEYFVQLSLTMKGCIDSLLFKKAWEFVIGNNEMLRTIFAWEKLNRPVQIVLKEIDIMIERIDLSGLADLSQKKIQLAKTKKRDRVHKYDLQIGPLFRVYLCKLEEESYEMIVSNHHIIYDGWSMGIILKEFFATYYSLKQGQPPARKNKTRFEQYLKFLNDIELQSYCEYWKNYLKDLNTKTSLPLTKGLGKEIRQVGKYYEKLSTDMEEKVNDFLQQDGLTLSMFIYTLWAILLYKFNSQNDDITFGITVSGRPENLSGVEDIVGVFINTIPLRIKIDEKKTIRDLMLLIKEKLTFCQSFSHASLQDIKSWSQIEANDKLFESIVVVENYPLYKYIDAIQGELLVENYILEEQSEFPLSFQVRTINGINLIFSYKLGLYDHDVIHHLYQYCTRLLTQMIEDPSRIIAELSLLTAEEKYHLIEGFNQTQTDFAKEKTIVQLFVEQVKRNPDRKAVVYDNDTLTYLELDKKVNQVAQILRSKGVKSDSIVGLMTERSVEMVIGIMGIIKAGGVFMPIDPKFPESRIQYMVSKSEQILVTQGSLLDKFNLSVEVVDLNDQDVYNQKVHNLECLTHPEDLAYVIYTSGSTGIPKGVMIDHRSVSNLVTGLYESIYSLHSDNLNIALLAPYVFDAAIKQFFAALLLGHTLFITPEDIRRDGERLVEYYNRYSIDISDGTPAHIYLLQSACKFAEKPGVKHYIIGGEALSVQIVKDFLNACGEPKPQITNIYGPAECCVDTTAFLIERDKLDEVSSIPIGKPLANKKVYILDQNLQPVPVGVVGEIYISGEGISRGYLDDPEQTAVRFIPNPFMPGYEMYKTGDLGRWQKNGNVEFMGRSDHQVKIRGYRIELGEIENKLLEYLEVTGAAVIDRTDVKDIKYLCAYFTASRELSVKELKEYLHQSLPDYMIPTYYLQLEAIPLTHNGKVDRKALPVDNLGSTGVEEYVGPIDRVEARLVQIWAEILGIEKIGVLDNFFALGGHSLRAITLTSQIYKEFDVKLPVKIIFNYPVLWEMAEQIKAAEKNIYEMIAKVEPREYYPLSSAQKRMFVLNQMAEKSINYNIFTALLVKGELYQKQLEEAFDKLVEHHESLRTGFELQGSEPVQRVYENIEVDFTILSAVTKGVEDLIKDFIRPFDLSKPGLFRAALIRRESGDIFLFDMHHIITDGRGMEILVEDLIQLYHAKTLQPLPIQYTDFAVWQNQLLQTELIKKQEEYWLNSFVGEIPVLNMPLDYPRPAEVSYQGAEYEFVLDEDLTEKLRTMASEYDVTLYMILLAVISVLLAKYTGQNDIIIGSPVIGRSHPDLEKLIGMFVNTLPMRNQPIAEKVFKEFLAEVKITALEGYEHQDYPFERLIDKLNLVRDLGHNPLFDVMLTMLNTDNTNISFGDVEFTPYKFDQSTAKFDLSWNVISREKDLRVRLIYSTDLFRSQTIQRLAGHLINITREIVNDPSRIIAELSLLTAEEKYHLIEGFNQTQTDFAKEKTIVQLFVEQVKRNPDRKAVVYDNDTLTYLELDKKVNQVAQILRSKGVKSDSIVGLMTERSVEMVIGIMGIIKAGGVFMPIDPKFPESRIQYMVSKSEQILVTQGSLLDKFNLSVEVVDLNDQDVYNQKVHNLECLTHPEDLAYVIYTSGSTGIPKGVMIDHRSVSNLVTGLYESIYSLHSDNLNIALLAPYVFDAAIKQFFAALLLGHTLFITPEDIRRDGERLVEYYNRYSIDISDGTPAHIYLLQSACKFAEKPGVKHYIIGGEALSVQIVKDFLNACGEPKPQITNIYGPAECCVDTTAFLIERDKLDEVSSIPIGKPLANKKVYILDQNLQPVPVGVVGEIYISGEGISRGYLDDPEQTAVRFIPNPFMPGYEMYKTGDLGRWQKNGNVEFMGRSDHQVKIRGYRIELGEIENKLLEYLEVTGAAVIDRTDVKDIKYLCAYFTASRELSVKELKEYLHQSLPDYMIPTYYLQLEAIPLTHNGKVDRKALPVDNLGSTGVEEYVGPIDRVEARLVQIWAEILGIEKIGVLDNFFALGGHSLRAITLTSQIYKEFDVKLPVKIIFNYPVLWEMAEQIKAAEKNIYEMIAKVEPREYYPLSSAQKRMFVLNQMAEKSINYNIFTALLVKGELYQKQLEEAFDKLVEHHESLRTGFELQGSEPVQRVYENIEVDFTILSAVTKGVEDLIKDFIRPFDLSKPGLFRAALIRRESGDIFLFDMHHIITDGRGMEILVEDLIQLYHAKTLQPLPIQYTDFAVWQNQLLQTELIKKQEEYWLNSFVGEIPVLNMPLDYPRPAEVSYQGAEYEFVLDEDLTEKLRTMASEYDVTLYMILLAVISVLLAKYTGQNDIIIGSPVIGRSHPDLEKLIGMFVNTLPMRNQPIAEKVFKEFLAEVKITALEGYEHQDYPFERLIDKLNLVRDLGHNPLFDVMLTMLNTDNTNISFGDVEFTPYKFDQSTAKFDLSWNVISREKDLRVRLIYSTDLFRSQTIQRLAGHSIQLIQGILNNPEVKISEIDILTQNEKEQLLFDFNDTANAYPNEKILHQMFEEQVERTPDKVAVVFKGQALTYLEVNSKANILAHQLSRLGVTSNQIISICLNRSLEMLIAIWGILKAGASYLPLDPTNPMERLSYILQDANSPILIKEENELMLPTYEGLILSFEAERMVVTVHITEITTALYPQKRDSKNLGLTVTPTDLAYVIYTSGSTGQPKGVMIQHQSVLNRINWMQRVYSIDEDDVILQKTQFTFDVSVWELFWWSFVGARVVLLVPEVEKDPEELLNAIERFKVSVLHFVPSMLTAFLDYIGKIEIGKRLISLRQVFASGETLQPIQVERFNQYVYSVSGATLHNLYGPTEATVDVTYYDCPITGPIYRVPIGKPIDNTKIYILNESQQLQPIGVPGELCIAGAGLAKGYLNRDDLTAKKFVTNPYNSTEQIYRTGDLARWLDDGNIEFIGRIDYQIKIRGYRIELGEIEKKLLEHPEVKGAAVIDHLDQKGEKYLCAYVTLKGDLPIWELKDYLIEKLPTYMIPTYFVKTAKIPLNTNGKIDRKALLKEKINYERAVEYVAPQNVIEVQIAKMWSEIFEVENISVLDNFFTLGGHSLKAISLVTQVKKEFDVKLSVKVIFNFPILRDFAAQVKGAMNKDLPLITKVEKRDAYPLSSAQNRIFVLHKLAEQRVNYNISSLMHVEGDLDKKRFVGAFRQLVERHESLRTSFHMIDGEPMQIIHYNAEVTLKVLSVEEEELTSVSRDLIKPFDLSIPGLIRLTLIEGKNKNFLLLDMHHIITDGHGIDILLKDFAKLYQGNDLQPLSIQYKDFTMWQNQLLTDGVLKDQEVYWIHRFANDIPVLNLPTDYPRSGTRNYFGDIYEVVLDTEFAVKTKEFAVEFGVTLYMVFLAIFNVLLARYTGQDDIIIGSPVLGRSDADLEQIVGVFVNTLAIRNQPLGEKTFAEFLAEVQTSALDAYENQDYPFEMLIEKINLPRDPGRNPLFDVMLTYTQLKGSNTRVGDLILSPIKVGRTSSKFDLSLGITENVDRINLEFEYSTELFKNQTVEKLAKHYLRLLEEIIKNPEVKIAEIDILTTVERKLLLCDFNSKVLGESLDKTFQHAFEEEVARSPEDIAVIFEDNFLSYEELNQSANRLARTLRGRGVKPDQIVPIMIERSIAMVVGVLGILKSGGAYLPLDPQYPKERLIYMLEDSQAQLMVTYKSVNKEIEFNGEVIDLEMSLNEEQNGANLKTLNSPTDLAYVIYTSGSTGKPKGIMVQHDNYLTIAQAWTAEHRLGDFKIRLLQTASYSFDVFAGDLARTLLNSGLMVICPEDQKMDPVSLYELIRKYSINYLDITPLVAVPLMNYIKEHGLQIDDLKLLVIGSDSCSARDFKEIVRWFGDKFRIINSYGITETTIDSSYYEEPFEKIPDKGNTPIGKPLPNVRCYVLDSFLRLQPVNVPGELYISGYSVSRGYWNREELTDARFLSDPFVPGAKMYKTGDMVKWLEDGNLAFLGRMDHQVKIRGFRIELAEIEQTLLSHNAVLKVIVTDRVDASQERYLCAYLITDEELSLSAIRSYLTERIPEYMIPAYFVTLDKFPVTLNGKVDWKNLPNPLEYMLRESEHQSPETKIEIELVEIWREILRVDRIGINDNFFEIGGHSVKAIKLISWINQKYNVHVQLTHVFKYPTIKEFAVYIHECEESNLVINLVEEQEYYPASAAQKRMFILDGFEDQSTVYNMPGLLVLEGEVDYCRIEQVFSKLVERHEALRTSFLIKEGEPVQQIQQDVDFKMEFFETSIDSTIDDIFAEFVRPFDLSKAPIFRVKLVKKGSRYFLMYDIHHIISDERSMEVLTDEFKKLYHHIKLQELTIQYKDFAVWQNQFFKSEKLKEQEKYWLNKFAGEIPVLNLPTDLPRPAIIKYLGDRIHFELSQRQRRKLKELSARTGVTNFILLFAVYYLFLSKYTGQDDLVIGTPITGRNHEDLVNIIGIFVNTLAIRIQVEQKNSFDDFLKNVKTQLLEAFDNQDYPFDTLIEKLNLKRDMSRNSIFDSMFTLHNAESIGMSLLDLQLNPYRIDQKTSKFDLSLDVIESENKIEFNLEYSTDLFERKTIERMARHYLQLLDLVIDNPKIRLAAVALVTPEDRQMLLKDFNSKRLDLPQNMIFQQIFEDQVKKTPDEIAVIYQDQALTYKELNSSANQLGRVLRKKGVKPDQIVAIMVERSIEMVIGVLGIMKSGGVYLPLDPKYPKDRLEYMVENSGTKIMLTQTQLAAQLDFAGEVLYIDKAAVYDCEDPADLEVINGSDDLAYVIYTSGSTGKPKGVLVQHDNFVAISLAWQYEYQLRKFTVRLLQMASFSFDVFAGDLARTLHNGGQMIICPEDIRLDPFSLYDLIRRHEINIFEATPTVIIPFMQYIKDQGLTLDNLQLLILGSDSCSVKDFSQLLVHFGDQMRIINSYGITEVTIDSSYYEESFDNLLAIGNVPIGKPLPNVRYYVLDANLNLLPVNVPGELYIAGVGVTRGYLNREELTAQKFIPDPFVPGERMYKTGDMVKWCEDGNVAFLGRMDFLVKIRGYRIELGEIESALLKYPKIHETVVVDLSDDVGEKFLCAYIVAKNHPSLKELRNYLLKVLPEYMVPTYFVVLDELPLSPNGKVDRKNLSSPTKMRIREQKYIPAENLLERDLVKIWNEILKLQLISVEDNFFEIGGHSLKAMQIISRIKERFKVDIPLSEVFKNPTIRELAVSINKYKNLNYLSLEKVEQKSCYPVSFAQRRVFVHTQIDPNSISYNIPMFCIIQGDFGQDRFEEAINRMVARHESLRTYFHVHEGQIVQNIVHQLDFNVLYLEGVEGDLPEITQNFVQPFDLSQPPLFRIGVVQFAKDKCLLIIDIHHIVCDGLGVSILVNELLQIYDGKDLSPLEYQYKDFAVWQDKLQNSDYLNKQEEYWLEKFSNNIPVLNLPLDYTRPEVLDFNGDKVTFVISEETTIKLKQIAQTKNVTLYMILLATYYILLAKYIGQSDLVVGTLISGRHHSCLEKIIGHFVNLLAMRIQVDEKHDFGNFLEVVKTMVLETYDNQDYPFEVLIEKLNLQRSVGRNPLFDVLFFMDNTQDYIAELSGCNISPYRDSNKIAKFDLSLGISESTDSNLKCALEYRTSLFKRSRIVDLRDKYQYIIEQIVNEEIDILPIEAIKIFTEEEQEMIVSESNLTGIDTEFDF